MKQRTHITRQLIATLFVGILLIAGTPRPALAEPSSSELQAQLDEANARLDEINIALLDAAEQLNETLYEIEQTEEKIADKEAEIQQTGAQIDQTKADIDKTASDIEAKKEDLRLAREYLSTRVSTDYKSGRVTFLTILLESKTFSEFISHIYYSDKVSEAENEAIVRVEGLKAELEEKQLELKEQQKSLEEQQAALESQQAELESQKSEQESLAARQAEQQAALEAQSAEQQAYVNGLDEQVQEALRREEEERKRAAEAAAAAAAAAAAQNGGSYYTPPAVTDTGSSTTSGLTAEQRNTIIAAAYSAMGTPYVFGGTTPGSGIDCSGLAQYAYAQAGVSLPHYSQAMLAICQPVQSISSLQPGDLVFWTYPRHVAIYLGDNMVIEAVQPAVTVQAIWGSPVGGGCPV